MPQVDSYNTRKLFPYLGRERTVEMTKLVQRGKAGVVQVRTVPVKYEDRDSEYVRGGEWRSRRVQGQ